MGFVALAVLNPGDPRPLPYVPLANPLEVSLALALGAIFLWVRRDARASVQILYRGLGIGAFIVLNGVVARTVHHWLGVPWQLSALAASRPLQAALTLTWTVAALAAMVVATRGHFRGLWLTGAGLLAAVVVKLFAIDLAALSGLTRVVASCLPKCFALNLAYESPASCFQCLTVVCRHCASGREIAGRGCGHAGGGRKEGSGWCGHDGSHER